MGVQQAIEAAEKILPGERASESLDQDPRWQAIIEIGEFLDTDPEPIWLFIKRWGSSNEDLCAAIGTCLLEHLLERHFETYFPRVADHLRAQPAFLPTFRMCAAFGQTQMPENRRRFDDLKKEFNLLVL